jgi:hypothetical protein
VKRSVCAHLSSFGVADDSPGPLRMVDERRTDHRLAR